jgi:hypothetical protein
MVTMVVHRRWVVGLVILLPSQNRLRGGRRVMFMFIRAIICAPGIGCGCLSWVPSPFSAVDCCGGSGSFLRRLMSFHFIGPRIWVIIFIW